MGAARRIAPWLGIVAAAGVLALPSSVAGKPTRCCYRYVGTIAQGNHQAPFQLSLTTRSGTGQGYDMVAHWSPTFSPALCRNAFATKPQTMLKAVVHIHNHQFVIPKGQGQDTADVKSHRVKNFTARFGTGGLVSGSFANDGFYFPQRKLNCSTGPVTFTAHYQSF